MERRTRPEGSVDVLQENVSVVSDRHGRLSGIRSHFGPPPVPSPDPHQMVWNAPVRAAAPERSEVQVSACPAALMDGDGAMREEEGEEGEGG